MQKIIFCTYDSDFLPYRATQWSIWYDLKAAESCIIEENEVTLVSTWIKLALPIWRGVKIYARSSLPVKMWLMVANSVWVIDADYRWELKVELISLSWKKNLGIWTRIAQLEIYPYFIPWESFPLSETPMIETIVDKNVYDNFENIYPSDRGVWGFWSTK